MKLDSKSGAIKLQLDEMTLRLIDAEYDIMAQNTDAAVIKKSKKQLGQMEAILRHENTINSFVTDIFEHYETCRAPLLTGKAMIVAYSRSIAMKIYQRILELLPPSWKMIGHNLMQAIVCVNIAYLWIKKGGLLSITSGLQAH